MKFLVIVTCLSGAACPRHDYTFGASFANATECVKHVNDLAKNYTSLKIGVVCKPVR
jgi:hypothetical protein